MTVILWLLVILFCAKKSLQGKKDYFPEIIDKESTFRVKLNETICLPCKVKKQYTGNRKCLFYWTKDGSVVLQWPRYRVKPNRCLRIRNIRSSDHAKFVCYAYSTIGNTQAVRNLIVLNRDVNATHQPEPQPSTKFKPSVPVPIFFRDTLKRTARLIRKYFYIGRRAKLKCQIVGSPPPKIKWFRNGVSLDGSKLVYIRPRSYVLIIEQFTANHIGNYTCVGSNGRGIVNMSFIVSNKSGDPNPPLPVKRERVVTEGDNVTLHCKKPANKVKWLVWHVPKRELRKQQNKGHPFGPYDPFGYLSEPLKSVNDNGSIVTDFFLYNISQKMHAGLYQCLALYKRSRKPVPVKIVNLKIQTDNPVAVIQTSSPSNEILLVKIAVPVMGSLLTLVVVIICFRCSRKTTVNNPAKPKPDDEENTLSMHILPNTPTGTLRIHKSLQEFTENDTKSINDTVIPRNTDTVLPRNNENVLPRNGDTVLPRNTENVLPRNTENLLPRNTDTILPRNTENTNTIDNEKITRTTNNSQFLKNTLYQNISSSLSSYKPYTTKPFEHGSCYSIPDSNTSNKRYSSSNENVNNSPCEREVNCKLQTNNGVDTKKYRHSKRHHKRSKHNNDLLTDCETSHPPTSSYNTHCTNGVIVGNNVPVTEIPESSEEDDQLLQREMKNWEPLIRDSTSYVCERTDVDSLRYDRTTNSDGKTLMMSQCNDTGNLLTSLSDCSQHIGI